VIRRWIMAVLILLLLLSGNVFLDACSQSLLPTKSGREFLVEVMDRGKPVGGLQIELSTDPGSGDAENRSVSTIRTDANGRARFANVPPGLYYIGIKHPAFGSSIEIEVVRVPPKGSLKKITFEWPGVKPISVQSLSGLLNGHVRTDRGLGADLLHPSYRPVEAAKLTLLNAISNEVLNFQITQKAGLLNFQSVPDGLYLLRIESTKTSSTRWSFPSDGYVPIEINSSAKLSSLNLLLDQAICGELGFENREEKIQ
jgi:hypothetical protein